MAGRAVRCGQGLLGVTATEIRYRKAVLMSRVALTRVCGLGALAVLCFVPAAAASAKEARPFSTEFSVRASNGYLISVSAGRHQLTITVAEGDLRSNHVVETTYTAPGAASPKGVEANLGTLGEISLRFVPSGRTIAKRRPGLPKGCKAPQTVIRRVGDFVGVMRFEGEAGYTAAEATEVHGSAGIPEGLFCATFSNGSGGEKHHPHPRVPSPPYLSATTAHNALDFAVAATGHHDGRVRFVASSTEKSGAISISRWVSVVAAPSNFELGPRLTTATVTPPPPFSGTATFRRRQKGPPLWTGSLAVSFPGAPGTLLTGPNFTSVILTR